MNLANSRDENNIELDDDGNPADDTGTPQSTQDGQEPASGVRFVDVTKQPEAAAPEPEPEPAKVEPAAADQQPVAGVPPPAHQEAATYDAGHDVTALTAKLDELATKAEKVEIDYDAGTIDGKERAAALRAIRTEENTVNVQIAEANVTARISASNVEREAKSYLAQLRDVNLAAGTIDYRKTAAAAAFDGAMKRVMADPASAGLGFKAAADKAHAMVLEDFGIKPNAKPEPQQQKVDPKAVQQSRQVDKSRIPPTLAHVPPAAIASTGEDEFSNLKGLDGFARERAVAKMSADELDRYLP